MTVDLSTVPLVALSKEARQAISTLLNPPRVIPSESGLPRDWRGLAHLSNLSGELMPLLTSHPDPSDYILTIWQQRQKTITVHDFQTILEKIDRWDILDDTVALFEKDAEKYFELAKRCETSAEVLQNEIDSKVLTVDDLHRLKQGLENQYYDAFLLYADEDVNFASEMVEKLENQYELKLCIKDRDLIGGITFEHEAVMTLISERCNRLIVIVSSNFLKSPANKFFLNYAQALGIDKRQRKVIPCLYGKCQLPPQLNYMFVLDYNRVGLYDFWGKLRDSVQIAKSARQNVNSVEPAKETISPEKENLQNSLKLKEQADAESPKADQADLLKVPDIAETENRGGVKGSENKSPSVSKKLKNQKITASCDSINSQKETGKKQNNLLRWTKGRWSRKAENSKKEYRPITETVSIGSLPSLTGLDSLNSVDSIDKKQKSTFLNKYVKKVQLKKILVKS